MKNRYLHISLRIILFVLFSTSVFAAKTPYRQFRIEITGINNPVILKNATLTLDAYRNNLGFPLKPEELRRFMRKGPALIQKAVKPYGYFQTEVQPELIQTHKVQIAHFIVSLGAGLPIRSVHIDIQGAGKHDKKFKHFLEKDIPFHAGSQLNTMDYETVKEKLYDLALERGYFQAKMLKSQIRINLTHYTARIIIIFNTGPRYFFGKTTFSKTPFYNAFLQRFLTYKEGHHFNAKKLADTQQGLVNSNYFDQVLIKPEPKKAVGLTVPVKISLILRKRKAYTLGLGYGTYTGLRGTLGLSLRRIGHHGHRFHMLIRASQDNSSAVAKYIIPGWNPADQIFTIGAGATNINQPTGVGHNFKFGLNYTLFSRHWKNSLTLAYLTEQYNLTNYPQTSTQLVYPTFESKYTNVKHPTNPKHGVMARLQLTGAAKDVLSETNFIQETFDFNSLYTIDKTHTRLLFRSDLGHTDIANINNLPLSLQLFAGGSRSVRGYDYNSIGPGRNLVVGSFEVQQRVVGAFYLGAFLDAGVVGNNNIFQHINAGTGPAFVWVSAIGPIELSFAEAFTQSNKPWTIQFTMGSDV